MRIAYVVTRADSVGGASIHVRDMARAMIECGHSAKVFVGGEGPVTEQLTAAGVAFHPLRFLRRSIHPRRDSRAVTELAAALRDDKPDLISLHTAKAGWVGRLAAARLGVPCVYTPHGWSFGDRSPLASRWAFLLAEKLAAGRPAAILCVCRYEKELAIRRGVGAHHRLRVIYNGVRDVPESLFASPARGPVHLVSVARLEKPKDPATLFQALAALGDRAWKLDLVGDGPMAPDLRRLAARLGIDERVRFLGYQPDPAPIMARAQIFVLSSRSEAFPRSILEALRAGLPVVASGVGGVEEAISDGENGFLVPPGDPEALTAALAGLLDDSNLRQRQGLQARRDYATRFRFERMAGELLSLYREFA